jgi:tight adherence protein C
MMEFALPALVGVSVLLGALGIYRLHRTAGRVAQRLHRIRGALRSHDAFQGDVPLEGRMPWWLRPLVPLSWLLPGQASSELLRWELASAGYRHQDAGRVFVGLRVLLAGCLAFVALWVTSTFTQMLQTEVLVVSGVGALLGFMVPPMLLRVRQAKRRTEITLALPDALDLLVICVEAGQGLNAALYSVTRESSLHSRVLAEELRLVNLEMSTGVPRAQALRNLALRTGIDDVRALVAVLVQSDKFGMSVAQALRTHARSLRTRRRQRAEEAARKTPVKMVFPLVFFIFPALLVVLLAPGMLELLKALGGMD